MATPWCALCLADFEARPQEERKEINRAGRSDLRFPRFARGVFQGSRLCSRHVLEARDEWQALMAQADAEAR